MIKVFDFLMRKDTENWSGNYEKWEQQVIKQWRSSRKHSSNFKHEGWAQKVSQNAHNINLLKCEKNNKKLGTTSFELIILLITQILKVNLLIYVRIMQAHI